MTPTTFLLSRFVDGDLPGQFGVDLTLIDGDVGIQFGGEIRGQ